MNDWNAETADWYAERYGEYDTNRLGVAALDLSADAVVVDVGCGTGCALRHAAERVTRGRLIGVDPVPRMIEIAQERAAGHEAAERIELVEGSASDIPLPDDCADVVLAFDSFDYWEDPARGLAEVERVLRPGGRLAVVKDGGVPDGAESRRKLESALSQSSFEVVDEKHLADGEVSCTLWLCAVR